jgi:transposase
MDGKVLGIERRPRWSKDEKFIWPSAKGGVVSISRAQMAYMLEGIDWRNPQLTWRPKSAG